MRPASPKPQRGGARKRALQPRVRTRLGWLPRLGTNEWGKVLVKCPQCGAPATATNTGDVWCRACGYTTAELMGCG